MKLRKGDEVIVLSGKDRARRGKIIRVYPALNKVVVDGINMVKRAYKPSSNRPKGGIREEPRPLWASKVAIVNPADPKRGARIGWQLDKAGKTKNRVYRSAGDKEIKLKS